MSEYIYEVFVTRHEYFYIEAATEEEAEEKLAEEVRGPNVIDWEENLTAVRGENIY
jgi:hypothetical protein